MGIERLVVCFDGTWNTPEDNTNVLRLYQAVADQSCGLAEQLKFYDPGVGTDFGKKVSGGAFGLGMDQNILQGYVWLCRNFAAGAVNGQGFASGPDIFVFGFSRGAFTARSLVGLVNRCGLIHLDKFSDKELKDEAMMRDSAVVKDAWKLYRAKLDLGRNDPEAVAFRKQNSHEVRVKFVGVWDTVGALGIPTLRTAALPVRSSIYEFHDLTLSPIVDNAFHAVAIDEHREDFNVALWTECKPEQTVEQRWFPGAHSNVGGGYEDDRLADLSLAWICEKAAGCGLRFLQAPWVNVKAKVEAKATLPPYLQLEGDEYEDTVRDSYADFMGGIYKIGRGVILKGRFYRPMAARGINEAIDRSAFAKWAADPDYRPRNLALSGRSVSPGEIGK